MIQARLSICVAVMAMAGVGSAVADVANVVSARDNTLYDSATGALSNGMGPTCFVGRTGTGLIRRTLLQFDLGAIPAGATINNVTLQLNMSMTSAGATNVSLYRLLADWGEGTSNAGTGGGSGVAATPGDATWIHTFYNTSFWTNPGGDFVGGASATTSVNAIGLYTWSSAQMLADVQGWQASPAANFGWILLGDETANNTSKRFDTRENSDSALRPMLIIDYTPVPGPSVVAALLGALLVPRRRRL